MRYVIYYTLPDEIYSKMWAKDEKQLIKFLHMLTNEQAYNFSVEVINHD